MKYQLTNLKSLLNDILTPEEVEKHVKLISKSGIITKQNDCRTIPKEVYVRNVGFLKMIGDYKTESDRSSELTGEYMYSESFWGPCYLGEQKFRNVANKLALHLLNNPVILSSYLNEKYNLNITKKDLIISDINEYSRIKDESLKKRVAGRFSKVKRNFVVVDGISYVSTNNMVVELDPYNRIIKTMELIQ